MLSIYFSILVIALVVIVFLGVCYILVCGMPKGFRRRKEDVPAEEELADLYSDKVTEEPAREAPKADSASEATQIFNFGGEELAKANEEEATRIFDKKELTGAIHRKSGEKRSANGFVLEPEPEIMEDGEDPEVLEEYFFRHFLNQYGAVSRTVAQDTRTVTHQLVQRVEDFAGRDSADILTHIMVQEALQNAQRTYAMLPNDTVLGMVSDAFCDVAQGDKTDTRTILAYDALKAMPRMEMGQFHALSLLLLFHYSRNMDNVDAGALRAYAERYVEPFLQELPNEYSGYQQLEYLHCISLENKDTAFGQVLRDSYPLVFSFRGCMKAELESIRKDWPEGAIVPSLFNSYYKASVIDESLLPDYFEKYGIESGKEQTLMNALIHSRPVAYDRRETTHILGKISPSMARLQEVWDGSLLRRSSLTLMGMYIAQIHIRECIGEEFDLSHWM